MYLIYLITYALPPNIDLAGKESGTFRRGLFPREPYLGAQNTMAMVGGRSNKRTIGAVLIVACSPSLLSS